MYLQKIFSWGKCNALQTSHQRTSLLSHAARVALGCVTAAPLQADVHGERHRPDCVIKVTAEEQITHTAFKKSCKNNRH